MIHRTILKQTQFIKKNMILRLVTSLLSSKINYNPLAKRFVEEA